MKMFNCRIKATVDKFEVLEFSTVIVFIVLEYSLSSVVKHDR